MCPFSLDIAWLISSFHDDFAPLIRSGHLEEWPQLVRKSARQKQSRQVERENMSETRSGTTNQSGLFAAQLFESYSVGIVNLCPFSLEGTLHQLLNALRRLFALMKDPVHLLDNGHFNA